MDQAGAATASGGQLPTEGHAGYLPAGSQGPRPRTASARSPLWAEEEEGPGLAGGTAHGWAHRPRFYPGNCCKDPICRAHSISTDVTSCHSGLGHKSCHFTYHLGRKVRRLSQRSRPLHHMPHAPQCRLLPGTRFLLTVQDPAPTAEVVSAAGEWHRNKGGPCRELKNRDELPASHPLCHPCCVIQLVAAPLW